MGQRGDVEVAVLGPVTVTGTAEAFRRSAARDVVVYLAFHRGGVRRDQLAVALWPDSAVSLPTLHSTISDARRALGRAADRTPLLSSGRDLRLHAAVTSDFDRFCALTRADDPEMLLEAARLLRGRAFTGVRLADWAVLDGTAAWVESTVVGAVLGAVPSLLRRGHATAAERMIRRALVLSPYDERLYRALLRAVAAQGQRVGLRATMAQLLRLCVDGHGRVPGDGGEGPGLERLHPETTALYQELLCGWPATGGAPARL